MAVTALQRRWMSPAGHELAGVVRSRLVSGGSLDDVGLGRVDGLLDLRGISFGGRGAELHGRSVTGIAFDSADLTALRFVGCTVRDCRFDRAFCVDWRVRTTDMSRCSFVGANLLSSSLGAWLPGEERGNVYDHVQFTKAKMRRISTSAATYVDCDFSDADLREVNFWQSSLIRCTFAGAVRQVVFEGRMLGEAKPDPNPMHAVDFSAARLRGTDFRAVDLRRVVLPNDPDLLLIADVSVLNDASTQLTSHTGEHDTTFAATILDHLRKTLLPGTSGLVNLRDVASDAEFIADLLLAAGATRLG
ncbi:pentapeptide repeat-containing protein [Dactylosporangium sp. AC04546]|uniref:pentapeptide repeat-containing protein n=1 Tax=Dactylosporangium sp. AC04546 TaxID=2862460 RepID=UPI001EDF6CC0|nr:pentapeptide repeat-containing protein [Dactylosporangium sp. AC04546]WVK81014.1 pentapeptide repeat-containing protein [Dactylosporangium sp. AC04546]